MIRTCLLTSIKHTFLPVLISTPKLICSIKSKAECYLPYLYLYIFSILFDSKMIRNWINKFKFSYENNNIWLKFTVNINKWVCFTSRRRHRRMITRRTLNINVPDSLPWNHVLWTKREMKSNLCETLLAVDDPASFTTRVEANHTHLSFWRWRREVI